MRFYLSPDIESARVAIGQDVREGDRQRVVLTFEVETCALFDLRSPEASEIYAVASQPWRKRVAAGESAPSWLVGDTPRNRGYAGLVDPYQRRPGLRHIALFRWNEPDAPRVRKVRGPQPVSVIPDYR
jgi:hypothetical protein